MKDTIDVLDHGFVKIKNVMGDDTTVVNAARVSYGKEVTEMSEGDKKLLKFLLKHKHTSPFRHAMMTFHCKVPEFIARQWYKHVVGASFIGGEGMHAVDHGWNEISMRYVDASDFDFYVPTKCRKQHASSKQASVESDEDIFVGEHPATAVIGASSQVALRKYNDLVKAGVAKEQARMVLPLNIYTEFYWTISLQGVLHFITLRKDAGAQYEIREYTDALIEFVKQSFPHVYQAVLELEVK